MHWVVANNRYVKPFSPPLVIIQIQYRGVLLYTLIGKGLGGEEANDYLEDEELLEVCNLLSEILFHYISLQATITVMKLCLLLQM